MIRIDRGPEPLELPDVRRDELERFRAIVLTSGYDRNQLGTRYTAVKEALWRRQELKCCYCEKVCENVGNDLEHYRPTSRYWWLAWTWENLLFACQNCNRWAKNDDFPLADEKTRLKAEESPPQGEQPQLVDPATEDPLDSIQFVWDEASDRWLPRPRGASVKGAETIRVLELDRQALLELFQNYVRDYLMPDVNHLRELMKNGNEHAVRDTWKRNVRRALQRTMFYTALAHDVFDHYFPEDERRRWGLELPRP
ncbi:hypothetical protein CYFUS_009556 [Cystobacter fuscus]|uniref:HNH domain-containing protein n=1 Tax=Cystobacter fuscus TaxID=43 RepID=A0A250JJL3_9BACT|nr:hypothetical protein [Cystobacter fuscus]ATB44075.1 hypothetical protein CYFUS_009556 [Cystobacter fuscus]